MRLATERLTLRDIKSSDAKNIIKNINNLNISKWLLPVPYPYTTEDAKWYINHCQEGYAKHPRQSYNFVLERKQEPGVIGGLSISELDRKQKTAHIGYWLGENYWRQGYIKEAANRLLDYAFNTLRLKEIIIPVFEKNIPSNNLAKKLGGKFLKKDGPTTCKATGKKHMENVYKVTHSSWKRNLLK